MAKSDRTAKPRVNDLSTAERIARAKAKTEKLVDNALHLLDLHAANRIIVYSPQLASQIPRSYAARAFNVFQDASVKFEILRLCAVLDACQPDDLDKESIPAVIQLIDNPDVISALEAETRSQWGNVGTHVYEQDEDAETKRLVEDAIRASEIEFGRQQGIKTRTLLQLAILKTRKLERSSKLQAARNMRDKYIAHSLEQTHRDKRGTVKTMKYADERSLLWKAIAIIKALHIGVNGKNLTWRDSVRISRNNAAALWNGCKFAVLN